MRTSELKSVSYFKSKKIKEMHFKTQHLLKRRSFQIKPGSLVSAASSRTDALC